MKLHKQLATEGRINQNASLRDKQAVIVNAPIDKVWSVLIDFGKWKDWNSQIKWVKIDKIEEGADFSWNIQGSTLKSTIRKKEAPELLSWTGTYMGVKAIHVWKLDQTDGNQTIVTCEESMQGFLTIFLGHRKLHETLVHWLDELKKEVEKS